ncbi:MAG TPA: hypothetical protein VE264_00075 [Nitrososphaera sp.]|nr:hypothetical protein [Nitrososphaera sp.]
MLPRQTSESIVICSSAGPEDSTEKPSELRLDESGWHKIAEAIETAT